MLPVGGLYLDEYGTLLHRNDSDVYVRSGHEYGFTREQILAIHQMYFKHCEHVCLEGKLEFARDILNANFK